MHPPKVVTVGAAPFFLKDNNQISDVLWVGRVQKQKTPNFLLLGGMPFCRPIFPGEVFPRAVTI